METADHRILVRFLKKGRKQGSYDLLTVAGPPMLDVVLLWAEELTLIQPHELTDEETEAVAESC